MKAIVVAPAASIRRHASALQDADLPLPLIGPRDVQIRVQAVSVNPIDLKMSRAKPAADGTPRILGWDAAGTVTALGQEVKLFREGDRVYYAGSVLRPGCFSEYHSVDERLVAHAPEILSKVEAAALPLSGLAAWEALFDRFKIKRHSGGQRAATLLVVGGAGGVGSMAVQLAAHLTDLHVVATASRAQSRAHCIAMGAHSVINHTLPLAPQLKAIGRPQINYVLCLVEPTAVLSDLVQCLAPFGQICALVEADAPVDLNLLRAKSIGFSWEGMFTRSMFRTADMAEQGEILRNIAELVDTGLIKSTLKQHLGPIDADHLMKAHDLLATQRTIGKICLGT